jgi:hypothetical protein
MQPKHTFAALSKRDAIFMQPDNNDIIDGGMRTDAKGLIGAFPWCPFRESGPKLPMQQPTTKKIFMLTAGKGCFNLVTSDLKKNLEMFRQSTLDSGKSLNVPLVR